jgi:hypothetical protein
VSGFINGTYWIMCYLFSNMRLTDQEMLPLIIGLTLIRAWSIFTVNLRDTWGVLMLVLIATGILLFLLLLVC